MKKFVTRYSKKEEPKSITYPDYHKLAELVNYYYTSNNEDIAADELKLLFERGYQLGKRDGDANGWWEAREEDWAAWEQEAEVLSKERN